MTFPTPYTVDHYPWSSDETDELGNAVDGWTDDPTPVPVYSFSVGTTETLAESAAGETYDATVCAPPAWIPGIRDRVGLPDGVYEVVAHRLQCNGFHGWQPGNVILLRKAVGI